MKSTAITEEHNGRAEIVGKESLCCPVCGGKLSVHGTCVRKVRNANGVEILQLRVMKCRGCGKTHRELPEFVVPYKCTRYILHGEFYGSMEQSIVEDTLKKAVTKCGVPRRLYFDNGSQYRTYWMKRACGLLGIRLLYAKPRNSQGKGKQERFNRTLDAFLDEAGAAAR